MDQEISFFENIMQQRITRISALTQTAGVGTGMLAAQKFVANTRSSMGQDALDCSGSEPSTGDLSSVASGHQIDVFFAMG